MKNLNVHFGNLFTSGNPISDLAVKSFTEDHLVKTAHFNTGGQYDTMLNDTQGAYTNFYGEIKDEKVRKALLGADSEAIRRCHKDDNQRRMAS